MGLTCFGSWFHYLQNMTTIFPGSWRPPCGSQRQSWVFHCPSSKWILNFHHSTADIISSSPIWLSQEFVCRTTLCFVVCCLIRSLKPGESKDTVWEQWLKKRLHCTADRSRANVRKHLKHTTLFGTGTCVWRWDVCDATAKKKSVPRTWCYNPPATCVAGLQRTIRSPCPTNQLDHAWSVSLKYWTVLNL